MNMLWSYAYARKVELDAFLHQLPVERLRFFADSGAHSARTLGITIGLDEYAGWVKRWEPLFTVYANLDVIGAPQATRDNQTRLEQVHGLDPMPVFHTGEPFEWLDKYLADGYTYIALGKLLGNPVKVLRPWLAQCFKMAEGRAVFHGFGMTTWPLLKEFPFYSVDSSSWGSVFRYGTLRLFDKGRWFTIFLRDRDALHRNREVVDSYRIPYTVFTRGGYDRDVAGAASAAAYYRAADWIRKIHGPISLPPGKGYPRKATAPKVLPAGDPGVTTYLADTATNWHQAHAKGIAGGVIVYLADTRRHIHQRHVQAHTEGLV